MKKERILILLFINAVLFGILFLFVALKDEKKSITSDAAVSIIEKNDNEIKTEPASRESLHPMSIESLRTNNYPGGDFVIEEKLANGTNYEQYIASYKSEGLKIFGLLTVPIKDRPENGFPSILFIHGYIDPKIYSTTGNYPSYQARLARAGFITFKPDLRGHGNSEGVAVGAHFSEKYVIDTLNALAYLKEYKDADPDRIGYWGHSNGGEIGLRAAVISKDIKAHSFWAGVVGSYKDMFEVYNEKIGFLRRASGTELIKKNKLPSENPEFWNKLDPYAYLTDISAPIQLQHATGDESVPIILSQRLKEELEKAGKEVEYVEYKGDDHNIGANSSLAFQRTIDFYNKYLIPLEKKGGTLLTPPLAEFKKRITKKPFGIYITPETSPVKPERFRGYHTGVDIEYSDIATDVDVSAIADGEVVYSAYVRGYGGTVIINHIIDEKNYLALYGHLDPSSLASKNKKLNAGEKIGILGDDSSTETDGERKHLHLSIYMGENINFQGYVQNKKELDKWLDPLILFK